MSGMRRMGCETFGALKSKVPSFDPGFMNYDSFREFFRESHAVHACGCPLGARTPFSTRLVLGFFSSLHLHGARAPIKQFHLTTGQAFASHSTSRGL